MSQNSCCGNVCTEEAPAQAANVTPETQTVPAVHVTPRADLWEAGDAFVLSVEMPGVSDTDADLTLEKNVLTVRGVAKFQGGEGLRPALGDCRQRQYDRSFRLSDAIDGQHLDATVKDGVLTVRLPKAQHAVSKKIAVRPA
jgi:HSP20 family molecular chaperone IbpA